MISVLVLQAAPPCAALAADLAAGGLKVLAEVPCNKLVHEAVHQAPDGVVAWQPEPDEGFWTALAALQDHCPLPVLVFTQDARVESLERALDLGVGAWVVQAYAPARLRALLQLAQARFRRERAQRESYEELLRRFEERKLVDRAKGILMQTRGLPEDEAFALLRAGAMQSHQRVGQVSKLVIGAAQDAQLVNRTGQLRMLSQRLVLLHALQLPSGNAAVAARLHELIARVETALEQLARALSRPTYGDLLDALTDAWTPLRAAAERPPQADKLLQLDALAEGLLRAADTLTAALQHAGRVPRLHVVNLAGRQRMLGQRLAKEALLAAWLPPPAAALARQAAAATAAEARAALTELEGSPLSSAAMRESLAAASACSAKLAAAIDHAAEPAGRALLIEAGDALLEHQERLVEQVEHSMHLLIG